MHDGKDRGEAEEGRGVWHTLQAVWYNVSPFVYAVAAAMLIRAFVIEPWIVPTGSMLQTIRLNDLVWAEKVSFRFRDPEPGDIVVFDSPYEEGVTLVKRVIAVGGQTIDFVDGAVVVDGQTLDEPYTSGQETWPFDDVWDEDDPPEYPYTVPEGCVWVMGDNRGDSRDSRYYGPVGLDEIKGHAVCITWPLDHIGLL